MRLSLTPASLVAWVALGATVAVAAPAAPATPAAKPSKPSDAKPQAQCPTPDKDACLAKGYLDSFCGQKHLAVCKPFAEKAMEDHYNGKAAPKIKMLRPRLSDMPKHVESGKYFAYKKMPEITRQGAPKLADKIYKKARDVLAGISGMDMTTKPPVDRVTKVDPNEAAKFHRNPAWKANGPAVRSCKEYAYARSYNAARFIDAASACRGDRECVFSVAYMSAPTGISGPPLRDEDNVPMARQLKLPTGKFQKNDMFAPGMEGFIEVPSVTLPNGMVVQNTEVAALKSALRAGKEYYEIGLCSGGGCNGTRKFKDVWAWHKHLHDRTAALSQNEAEEYERRRAKIRALIEQWGAAVAYEKSLGKGIILEQPVVLPYDMRAHDPFERYRIEGEYIERGRDARVLFKQRFGVEIFEQPRSVVIPQLKQKQGMQGAWQPSGAAMATGLLAAPAPAPAPKAKADTGPTSGAGTTAAVDHSPAFLSDSPEISKCLAPNGWGLEMSYKGPISCRIQEFLLGEWRRKAAGQKSCLDLGNLDCDWTLQMFEAGVLAEVQKLDVQVADETYCDAYIEGDTFTDKPNSVARVTEVKRRLDAYRTVLEEQLKGVSDYVVKSNAGPRRLGKSWEGGDFAGDKDWFAAGYEYGLGWEVGQAKQTADKAVCQLQGSVYGDVGFDAWIVGNRISVVEGELRAEAKPDVGRFKAHLKMMGEKVIDHGDWVAAQTIQPAGDFGVQVPGGLRPRFDIYVGVPISGELWGELLFGSSLEVTVGKSTSCKGELEDPKFGVNARYTPFFGAFGIGKVGVGIAGIASAGIRASLTLVMLGLPLDIGMKASLRDDKPVVTFSSQLGMMLATLSGRVSLYVEFLMFDEEFELFRWKGFFTEVPLMRKLNAEVGYGVFK